MQNSKFIQNLVSILICISLVFSNVLNAGALTISANKMVSVYSSEYFELDGQTYILETVKIPGASAAAIAALASAIVADAGSSYTYKLETWTATDGTFFYQKSVLKIYNKETGEKVGSSIVKETKTHIK